MKEQGGLNMLLNITKSLVISFLLVSVTSTRPVYSHSGKLDKQGGHFVSKTWTSKQGLVFRQGTYHFHDVSKQFGSVSISESDGKQYLNIGSLNNVNKVKVEIPASLNKSDTEKFISETLDRFLGPFVVSKRELKKYKADLNG